MERNSCPCNNMTCTAHVKRFQTFPNNMLDPPPPGTLKCRQSTPYFVWKSITPGPSYDYWKTFISSQMSWMQFIMFWDTGCSSWIGQISACFDGEITVKFPQLSWFVNDDGIRTCFEVCLHSRGFPWSCSWEEMTQCYENDYSYLKSSHLCLETMIMTTINFNEWSLGFMDLIWSCIKGTSGGPRRTIPIPVEACISEVMSMTWHDISWYICQEMQQVSLSISLLSAILPFGLWLICNR